MPYIFRYCISLALVLGAGVFEAFCVFLNVPDWWSSLTLPPFLPPWPLAIFVWLLLSLFLSLALARVWGREDSPGRRRWAAAFWVQFFLGILWAVFFSFDALFLAIVAGILLWFAIIVLTLGSWDLDRPSFWLLAPYAACATFLMIVCASIWWLN